MTLVTATVEDVGGTPDESVWLFSSTLRKSGDGSEIITPKWVRHKPVEGLVSINLDPGYSLVSYRGKEYVVEVPDSGPADLWDLIAASVAFPPGTSPELVGRAVMAYLSQNEIASTGLTAAVRASLAKADSAVQAAGLTSAVTTAVNGLINGAPGTRDTLKEISDILTADEGALAALTSVVASKVPINPTTGITYNIDGSVATVTENGVTTTFTYNSDGTVHTDTRLGVTRTYTYNGSGNLTGIAS